METVQVRLTRNQVNELDELVKEGIYGSRGEAVRDAVRRLELMNRISELQKLAGKKGIKKSELLKELEKVENDLSEQRFA